MFNFNQSGYPVDSAENRERLEDQKEAAHTRYVLRLTGDLAFRPPHRNVKPPRINPCDALAGQYNDIELSECASMSDLEKETSKLRPDRLKYMFIHHAGIDGQTGPVYPFADFALGAEGKNFDMLCGRFNAALGETKYQTSIHGPIQSLRLRIENTSANFANLNNWSLTDVPTASIQGENGSYANVLRFSTPQLKRLFFDALVKEHKKPDSAFLPGILIVAQPAYNSREASFVMDQKKKAVIHPARIQWSLHSQSQFAIVPSKPNVDTAIRLAEAQSNELGPGAQRLLFV